MTSNDLKMTSKNENYKLISKKVKTKNNLRGGVPNEDSIHGRDLIEQAFSSQSMAEFIESLMKYSKVRNEISKTIEKKKYIESYSAQSKIGQNASYQSKVFEQAINIIGDTIENMDIQKEQKDKRIEFLEIKIGLPDFKVIEEMNKLGLKKHHFKKKVIGLRRG